MSPLFHSRKLSSNEDTIDVFHTAATEIAHYYREDYVDELIDEEFSSES